MSLNIFRWDIWIPWRIDFLAAPRQHISFADRSSPSYSSTGPTATGVVASAEPGRLRFIGWSSSFSRLGASSRVMAALCWCGCGVYLVNMVPSSLPSRLSTMASRLVGVNSWRLFCPLRLGFVGVVAAVMVASLCNLVLQTLHWCVGADGIPVCFFLEVEILDLWIYQRWQLRCFFPQWR